MISKPWLLPDGVEEILPEQAAKIESLRRQVLDVYARWGYQLVIPPLLEFSESLFAGLGRDVQSQTLQFGDPMSAELLALRADITPQIARMDAHSLAAGERSQSGLNRLCYVGSVVKSRVSQSENSRVPITAGAELYGDASIDADCEVILLMLQTLEVAGLSDVHLALGHVDIYRQLIAGIDMSEFECSNLFDAIQRKAQAEIDACLRQITMTDNQRQCLSQLASLHGDVSMLDKAEALFSAAPQDVLTAIQDLRTLANKISARNKNATLYFDLSELRTYGYHSGLVFSALTPGLGRAIAKGGRYDCVGEVFGRARPATGFHVELKTLSLLMPEHIEQTSVAYALDDNDQVWAAVEALREQGERIICTRDKKTFDAAVRQLVFGDAQWRIVENK